MLTTTAFKKESLYSSEPGVFFYALGEEVVVISGIEKLREQLKGRGAGVYGVSLNGFNAVRLEINKYGELAARHQTLKTRELYQLARASEQALKHRELELNQSPEQGAIEAGFKPDSIAYSQYQVSYMLASECWQKYHNNQG